MAVSWPHLMTELLMADLPQIFLTQDDLDRLLRFVEMPGDRSERLASERREVTLVAATQRYRIVNVPFQPEAAGETG